MHSPSTRTKPVHPHGRGDGAYNPPPRPGLPRFTPTGVGTALETTDAGLKGFRFTPTGVGTALMLL